MLKQVDELLTLAQGKPKKRLAVVFAHDDLVIHAIKEALDLGIIDPILIGIKGDILRYAQIEGIQNKVTIIDEPDPEKAVQRTMELVHEGSVDFIMKGLIDTKIVLKGVVNKAFGIRSNSLLSHVGLISIKDFERVLFVSDGAMNIQPSIEDKIQIIENAVALTHQLGYLEPKVGMVSAVEKLNPKMLSTVEAEAIKTHYAAHPGKFLIDGPFAIDNLVSLESVRHKGIQSLVAGHADILMFPNIDAGNIFYKTTVFLAHAQSAGIVLGATVPIVLTSRADDAHSKLCSIALGVILCA